MLCIETQIELILLKNSTSEDIIERPPLKARLGDVAQEFWVNSILNLLCLCVFSIMFLLLLHCLCISQYYQSIAQNNIGISMHEFVIP